MQKAQPVLKKKGSELVLVLCKEFIDRYKDRIWVKSIPGKGSVIYFTIPHTY